MCFANCVDFGLAWTITLYDVLCVQGAGDFQHRWSDRAHPLDGAGEDPARLSLPQHQQVLGTLPPRPGRSAFPTSFPLPFLP